MATYQSLRADAGGGRGVCACSGVELEPVNPHLRVKEGRCAVGLKNIGNTCYFNSLLQVKRTDTHSDTHAHTHTLSRARAHTHTKSIGNTCWSVPSCRESTDTDTLPLYICYWYGVCVSAPGTDRCICYARRTTQSRDSARQSCAHQPPPRTL
eukprot:1371979-Rhodomonas_salina.1